MNTTNQPDINLQIRLMEGKRVQKNKSMSNRSTPFEEKCSLLVKSRREIKRRLNALDVNVEMTDSGLRVEVKRNNRFTSYTVPSEQIKSMAVVNIINRIINKIS